MSSKRFLIPAVLVAIVVIGASALAWRSQASTREGDRPAGGVLGGEGEAAAAAASVPGGPGFYAQSAFAFRPYSQADEWAYSATALYNPGANWATYEAPLSLPQGAAVTKFVVYFIDQDVDNDLWIALARCSLDLPSCSTMAQISSSGAEQGPRFAEGTVIAEPVVDNQSNSYLVEVWLPSSPSASVGLIGIRVDYGYSINVPVVLKGQ
jgi:hypothetical protein